MVNLTYDYAKGEYTFNIIIGDQTFNVTLDSGSSYINVVNYINTNTSTSANCNTDSDNHGNTLSYLSETETVKEEHNLLKIQNYSFNVICFNNITSQTLTAAGLASHDTLAGGIFGMLPGDSYSFWEQPSVSAIPKKWYANFNDNTFFIGTLYPNVKNTISFIGLPRAPNYYEVPAKITSKNLSWTGKIMIDTGTTKSVFPSEFKNADSITVSIGTLNIIKENLENNTQFSSSSTGPIILGNVWMKDLILNFDIENNQFGIYRPSSPRSSLTLPVIIVIIVVSILIIVLFFMWITKKK